MCGKVTRFEPDVLRNLLTRFIDLIFKYGIPEQDNAQADYEDLFMDVDDYLKSRGI